MIGSNVMTKHKLDLESIQHIANNLEIKFFISEVSDGSPLYSSYCEIPSEVKHKPWELILSYIPTSEDSLDSVKLMQCYVEILQENELKNTSLINIYEKINKINNTLLFGKYSILENKLVYRYILNFPQFQDFDEDFLYDFLQMIFYNLESNFNTFNKS